MHVAVKSNPAAFKPRKYSALLQDSFYNDFFFILHHPHSCEKAVRFFYSVFEFFDREKCVFLSPYTQKMVLPHISKKL